MDTLLQFIAVQTNENQQDLTKGSTSDRIQLQKNFF